VRASLRTGAWLVVAYVATAVATTSWAPGAMRPLFDGFGSHPGEYLWVDPPREYAEGNRPPEPAQTTLRLAADGSAPGSASPPDGQVLAQFQSKAVPPHPPDQSAVVDVTPVAAGTLAPPPAGLRAEGNAYRVTVTYQPSGTPVERLDVPGTVGLTSVAPATVLLFSPEGGAWQRRDAAPLAKGNGLTGPFQEAGYYLAAAEGSRDEGSGGVPLIVYVLGAVVPLALAWLLLAGRARAGPRPARATGRGQGPSGSRKTPARPQAMRPPAKRPPAKKRPRRPPPRRR